MQLTVSGDISLADVAVLKYGNLEALFDIAAANGLNADAVPVAGAINLPVLDIKSKAGRRNTSGVVISPFIKASADQALVDLAIQAGGSVEAIFDVASLNSLNSLTDDLIIGNSYYKPSVINNTVIVKLNGFKPASAGSVPETQLPPVQEGIDYWIIENNFIVL